MGFMVSWGGLGFRVLGLGFRVYGLGSLGSLGSLGFRVFSVFRVCRVCRPLGFRVCESQWQRTQKAASENGGNQRGPYYLYLLYLSTF